MRRIPMQPPLPFLACLLACAAAGILPSAARAEDFSGFYAGLNAGYGWSREREPAGSGPAPGRPPTAFGERAGPDLPPSAATVAAGMRRGTPKSEAR